MVRSDGYVSAPCKDVVLTNVNDWLYCACKHEYLAQDFFDDEQLFELRLAYTTELVDLLRLVRVTLNSDKQEKICMKIGKLLEVTGDWRQIMGHVDKHHRKAVEASKNRKELPWIF